MFEDTETEGTSLELAMLPVSLTPDIWITVVHMLHASIMACALRIATHNCQQANLNHLCVASSLNNEHYFMP